MSDSSQVALRLLEESTWGVTPGAAMDALRFSSESLGQPKNTQVSNEIRPDGQVTDLIQLARMADGGISGELSYGTYDKLFKAVMRASDWTTLTDTGIVISADNASSEFRWASGSPPAFVVGQFVKVSGFTEAANNGFFRVTARDSDSITVDGTLTDEAAGDSVTVQGDVLTNGNVLTSFTLEKEFVDITQFLSYTGMSPGQMDLAFPVEGVATAAFTFMGKDAALAQATVGTGGPNAANENDVINTSNHLAVLTESSGALVGTHGTGLNISVQNSLRRQPALGSLTSVGLGLGRFVVTGELTAYFENELLLNRYLNHSESGVGLVVDGQGGAYGIYLPRVKFTGGGAPTPGNDQDITVTLPFQALREPGADVTMIISRMT
jgi:hypothetical protein